jgi:hypothetical protein
LGRAITPPVAFDFGEILKERLADHDTHCGLDEDHVLHKDDVPPLPFAPLPLPSPESPTSTVPARPDLTAPQRNKKKSKARRDKKRNEARASSDNPLLKRVHLRRVAESKAVALQVDLNATSLPHSRAAWIGSRAAQDQDVEDVEDFYSTDPASPPDLSSGMGGVLYSQEEVDALSGTKGFMYVGWLGACVHPSLPCEHRADCRAASPSPSLTGSGGL